MTDFFINIGITILLQLLSTRRIPAGYVKALLKVRDSLNLAFPPDRAGLPGDGFKITGTLAK